MQTFLISFSFTHCAFEKKSLLVRAFPSAADRPNAQ
jgi:hypothetical protein